MVFYVRITNILFHQKLRRHIHSKANTEITKKYVTLTSVLTYNIILTSIIL